MKTGSIFIQIVQIPLISSKALLLIYFVYHLSIYPKLEELNS